MKKLPAFMVALGIGSNRKIRRLTNAEFRCFICGVLVTAAESPERGVLLVAHGEPATPDDIAAAAGVPVKVADSTLKKLRKLHTIVPTEDGKAERLKNWTRWNPAPKKSETRDAWRERKQRERARKKTQRRDQEDDGQSPQLTMGTGGSSLKPTRRRQRPRPAPVSQSPTVAWVQRNVPELPEREAAAVVAQAWNARQDITADEVRRLVVAA